MNTTDIRDYVDLDDKDYRDQYDEFLDEVSGDVQIGSLTYSASQVLEKIDPAAYRCGFADWLDSTPEPYKCGECHETYEEEEDAEDCCGIDQ